MEVYFVASQPSTGLFGATPAFGTATSGTGAGLFGTSAFGQAGQVIYHYGSFDFFIVFIRNR